MRGGGTGGYGGQGDFRRLGAMSSIDITSRESSCFLLSQGNSVDGWGQWHSTCAASTFGVAETKVSTKSVCPLIHLHSGGSGEIIDPLGKVNCKDVLVIGVVQVHLNHLAIS